MMTAVTLVVCLLGAGYAYGKDPVADRKSKPDRIKSVIDELNRMRDPKKPHIPYGMVPPGDGRILQILVQASKPKRILEIGTGIGNSTLWMCLGLVQSGGGKILTIEIDRKMAELARQTMERAGVTQQVEVIEGDALEMIPGLGRSFDFVFIDGNKGQYLQYLDALLPLVREGGIIAAHDVAEMTDDMRDYLDVIKSKPCLDSILIRHDPPHQLDGSGVGITYKRCSQYDSIDGMSMHFDKRSPPEPPSDTAPVRYERLGTAGKFDTGAAFFLVDQKIKETELLGLGHHLLDQARPEFNNPESILIHIYTGQDAYHGRNDFGYSADEYYSRYAAVIRWGRKGSKVTYFINKNLK